MNIDVVLEGKLKETCFKTGADEFKKRLIGYVDLRIVETSSIDDYIKSLKPNDFKISLEIEGAMLSSPELAQKINEIQNDGYYNKIVFLIGGSDGLSDFARSKADYKLSLSKLTFLHQEACMILVEQIYRSFKILKKEPYHK